MTTPELPGADLADQAGTFTLRCSSCRACATMRLGHDHHHADAAVEGAVHFGGANAAGRGQPVEHRIADASGCAADRLESVGQHARNVVGEAAAGDVRKAGHGQRRQPARACSST